MQIQQISFAIVLALLAGSTFAKPISVSEDGHLGLYQAMDFRITDGNCNDCKTIPQALWYFKEETLAVPLSQPSDFSRTAQAQAEPTKEAQRAGIEHARVNAANKYRGRKPSYSRLQFETVRDMLTQGTGIGQVATATGLSRQTVYRLRDDAAGAEAALAEWGL